jgi:hypothetical protein
VIDVKTMIDADASTVDHRMRNRTGPAKQMVMECGLQTRQSS